MALTQKQLALRKDAVGGSEIGVLAGFSRWATPIEVFEAKVLGVEKEETAPMLFGVAFEEPNAQVYAARTGTWLKPVDSLINGKYPLAVATPDRAVFEKPVPMLARRKKLGLASMREAKKGLECKSTTWRQKEAWGPEGTDIIPDEHVAQVTWCMGVTGLREWDVACLIDRDEHRIYTVRFDEELFLGLYEIGSRFMRDHVIPKRPPPVDASEKYAEYLDRAWRTNRAELIPSDENLDNLCALLAYVKEAGKRVEAWEEWLANQVKAVIADAGGVEGSFGKLYWRREKTSRRFDAEAAFTEAHNIAALALQALPAGDLKAELEQQLVNVRGKHTTEKEGKRPLKLYPNAHMKARLAEGPDADLYDFVGPLPADSTQQQTQHNPQHNEEAHDR